MLIFQKRDSHSFELYYPGIPLMLHRHPDNVRSTNNFKRNA